MANEPLTQGMLSEHMLSEEKRLATIENRLSNLETKITSLETGVSDLVLAWKTAGGVVSFVKWLAGLAAAITAIIAFVKLGYWSPK